MRADRVKQRLERLWKDSPLFVDVLLCVVCFVFVRRLFLNQLLRREVFPSDLHAHLSGAINGEAYSIMSFFLRAAHRVHGYSGVASMLAALVVLTMWMSTLLVQSLLQSRDVPVRIDLARLFLAVMIVVFMASIYIPGFYGVYYYSAQGLYTDFTQPWHNSTFILMRLFSVLTLWLYYKIDAHYLEGISLRDWLLFVLALNLVNAAKPSFFIAFAPAMLCFLIYDFIRSRGRSVVRNIQFGVPVLLSIPVLLYQAKILYGDSSGEGSGFEISAQQFLNFVQNGHFLPYVIAGASFAIVVTLLCLVHRQCTRTLWFGWTIYLISAVERWFFFETGERAAHGNFSWGAKGMAFLLTLTCLERLIYMRKTRKLSMTAYLTASLLLALMFVSGAAYFLQLSGGTNYLI